MSDSDFNARVGRHTLDEARNAGMPWNLRPGPATAVAAAYFAPSFHAPVAVAVTLEPGAALLQVFSRFGAEPVLREAEARLIDPAGLQERLDAWMTRPRVDSGFVALDGMSAAAWIWPAGGPVRELAGHLCCAGPGDPLLEMAVDWCAVGLAHVSRRVARRRLEQVAAYVGIFEAVQVRGDHLRLVDQVSASHATSIEGALAALHGRPEAVVDLADCTFVAGMFHQRLRRFVRENPGARWRVRAATAELALALGVAETRLELLPDESEADLWGASAMPR